MRKILILLGIVQKHKNGKRRLNPYNPLSYITILSVLIIGTILFGILGIKEQIDGVNPFKWN
jgi:thiosulfate reductase cytochrome b subunit